MRCGDGRRRCSRPIKCSLQIGKDFNFSPPPNLKLDRSCFSRSEKAPHHTSLTSFSSSHNHNVSAHVLFCNQLQLSATLHRIFTQGIDKPQTRSPVGLQVPHPTCLHCCLLLSAAFITKFVLPTDKILLQNFEVLQ